MFQLHTLAKEQVVFLLFTFPGILIYFVIASRCATVGIVTLL